MSGGFTRPEMTLTGLGGSGAPKKKNTKWENMRDNTRVKKVNQMKILRSFFFFLSSLSLKSWQFDFEQQSSRMNPGRQKGKMCTVTQKGLLQTSNSSGKERVGDAQGESASASVVFPASVLQFCPAAVVAVSQFAFV